ncbi:MAG: carboxyltransferase [Proteobacteria bacterium]|nr:carboxyltransferase [Pseudomonadota bacterium]MBU2468244.1 carboxyltransferase [Pseudomonadota bacterium]MBU2518172.1 carboxyltransferase [Pseudomonadota bacterium]
MKHISFVDTSLRDGPQSLWNGRITTSMMLPIAPVIDRVGFEALDFMALISMDWCIRNLGENPWDRMRLMAQAMPNTPLIVGGVLRNFGNVPDSVTEYWALKIAEAGAQRIRINDPCHDTVQVKKAIQWSRAAGMTTMLALIFSQSPAHTDEYYGQKALEFAQAGADRLFIKDVDGLLTPERTRTLVKAIRRKVDGVPLEIHGHCTTGLEPLCYLEAIKLGVETVHTAVAPLANGPSQPSVDNILRNAERMGFRHDLNTSALAEMTEHFRFIAHNEGFATGAPVEFDLFQYEHQLPGGMLSNYQAELDKRGLGDKLEDLLREVALIRRELGYPIMVTPLSQYIGAQAILNYTLGERYKIVSDEIIKYALGHFGELIAPVEKEVMDKIKRLPRAKELQNWEPPQKPLEQLRQEVGKDLSDDEFLLRVLSSNQEAVDRVLAAGAQDYQYPRADQPVLAMVRKLLTDRGKTCVQVETEGFSLTLN